MGFQAPIKSGTFLKSEDFREGKTLVVTKAPEEVKANDEKYGRKEDGMTVNYYFQDEAGTELTFQNHGSRFARAFNSADLNAGDIITVKVTGMGMKTDYTITKA